MKTILFMGLTGHAQTLKTLSLDRFDFISANQLKCFDKSMLPPSEKSLLIMDWDFYLKDDHKAMLDQTHITAIAFVVTSDKLQELKSIKWHPKTALIISPECLASHDMLDSIKNMLNGKTAFDCTLKAFPELGEKIKAFEARKPKLSRDQLHMLKDIMCSKSIMEYVKKTGKARATLYRHLDQMVFQENVHNLEELKMKAINQGWLN